MHYPRSFHRRANVRTVVWLVVERSSYSEQKRSDTHRVRCRHDLISVEYTIAVPVHGSELPRLLCQHRVQLGLKVAILLLMITSGTSACRV